MQDLIVGLFLCLHVVCSVFIALGYIQFMALSEKLVYCSNNLLYFKVLHFGLFCCVSTGRSSDFQLLSFF